MWRSPRESRYGRSSCQTLKTRLQLQPGPKLFFDGAGWAFSFNMGVAQYLMQRYDLRRSPLYAISAGNFAAICILFNTDPEVLYH